MDQFAILKAVFGYDDFRPGQDSVVAGLIAGRDTFAVMPTGSGKSLCYQVPALVRGGLTIVISPLVALMKDQVSALQLLGVAAASINSSMPRDENVAVWKQVASGLVSILYLSPERLMTERMIAALQRLDVKLFAVDEAHCISQWGASFRPEYDALQNLKTAFPGVPIGAFTATADHATRDDIIRKIFPRKPDVFIAGFDRPNISLSVERKNNAGKQLQEFLEERKGDSGIVYTLSRKSAEETAKELVAKGYRALPYHAGLTAEIRAENQNVFMTEKAVIICATIAFGMGIDKPDVRFVFHADLPGSLDAYYQEIGRAGRDGEPADAYMVFGMQDVAMRRRFIAEENGNEDRKRRENRRLDALIAYCEAPDCRRQSLLSYFGEASEPCGNCDCCLDPSASLNGTIEATLVLQAILQTGERYGPAHIVDLLLGEASDKAVMAGHTQLALFGQGKDRKRQTWYDFLRQMQGGGVLQLDVAGHGGLSLTAKGRAILKGEQEFFHRAGKPSRKGQKTKTATPLTTPQNEELLARLKKLRFSLARLRKAPAYVIFSDRTLIDMAHKMPLTAMDFAQVHGVGAAKLEQFAKPFLQEIGEFVASQQNLKRVGQTSSGKM